MSAQTRPLLPTALAGPPWHGCSRLLWRSALHVPHVDSGPAFVHAPSQDGTYAIFHIGTGTGPADGGKNCTPAPPGPPAPPPPAVPCTGVAPLPGWKCSAHVCAGDGQHAEGQCGADLGEPKLDCTAGDVAGCSAAAAKACLATPKCVAFAMSHIWPSGSGGYQSAKLFSSAVATTPNKDWSVWTKAAHPVYEPGVAVAGAPWAGGVGDAIDHGVVFGQHEGFAARVQAGGSTIHVAKSLDGPWEPLVSNHLGGCNNPAPWVHPNGTIYCLCGNTVLRTDDIAGNWTHISSLSHSGVRDVTSRCDTAGAGATPVDLVSPSSSFALTHTPPPPVTQYTRALPAMLAALVRALVRARSSLSWVLMPRCCGVPVGVLALGVCPPPSPPNPPVFAFLASSSFHLHRAPLATTRTLSCTRTRAGGI